MNSGRLGLSVLGILLLLAGITFALQGANYIGGSSMSGNSFWLYAGAGVAILGVGILIGSFAMKPRNRNTPPAVSTPAA